MNQFISRAYNTFELNKTHSILTKTSDANRLNDEIRYYRSLPKELSIFFPRLVKSKTGDTNSLSLEYYAYDDLGKLMVSGNFAQEEATWYKAFFYLKDIFKCFFGDSFKNQSDHISSMYINKTQNEHAKLGEFNVFFNKLFIYDKININGQSYYNFSKIWPRIIPFLNEKFTHRFVAIHGDLCFSNILYGNNANGHAVLKLIDPRGSFGKRGYSGDSCYDFAKLFHSFEGGYEYIIRDQYELENVTNNFTFSFKNDNRAKIKEIFYRVFDDFDFFQEFKTHFKVLQGLIYIGMCARHYDNLDRQKIMYCTGVRILNEWLEENNL